MVTDYDCWHPDHEAVSVESVIKVIEKNRDNANLLLKNALPRLKFGLMRIFREATEHWTSR